MPVLARSEMTSPQLGFSMNRCTAPPSSTTTTPYSSGLGTGLSTMVARARCSRWKRIAAPRSMSVSASPEMTRKGSVSCWRASMTEPAVPSGESSTEYVSDTPCSEPSPK